MKSGHHIEEDNLPSFFFELLIILAMLIILGFTFNTIDCSHPVYPTNLTRTLEIMKYCTGGEKEVP